jgi:hypothetical protein
MKKYIFLLLIAASLASTVKAQFTNVLLGKLNYPNEPAIGISLNNPSVMVAGANISNVYYSSDAGETWTADTLACSAGDWGDPCIVSDQSGNFYYFHLNRNNSGAYYDRIVCQKSADGGRTWTDGTTFGYNNGKTQEKEWAVFDPGTGNLYITWTQDDLENSSNPLDSSHIYFARSTDGGMNWSTPARVNKQGGHCIVDGFGVNGSFPEVGPSGEVYVTWAGPNGIQFTKSVDGGLSWPSDNVTVASLPVGWGCLIPGIKRGNGMPVIACDRSSSPYRGTIYINWSDQRNGQGDTEIWLSRSTDGGVNWSAPIRVNDDATGNQNFFSSMAVDQVTGNIYFVFYDRRSYSDNKTDVYMAVSKDGGTTFQNFRISASPFTPNGSIFFGDYCSIKAHNNQVRPVWTRMSNDSLSIWTAMVTMNNLGINEDMETARAALEQNFPNPVLNYTSIAYKVYSPANATLRIYDLAGKEVSSVFENRFHPAGQYIEHVSVQGLKLAPGIYFYTLSYGDTLEKRKMIVR